MSFPNSPQYAPADPKTSGVAMASLFTGVAGMATVVCFPLGICAVLAVILGVMALRDIRGGARTGSGLAAAGILLGVLSLGLLAAVVVMASFGSTYR